jgi:galactokinase
MQEIIRKVFTEKYGTDNIRMFAAPGRINLIGEHTDYNEGFVMPAAIDKRIYLAIAPSADSVSKIFSYNLNKEVIFNSATAKEQLPQWALYSFGVINELKVAGFDTGNFNAVFGGDIPSGAGLSSSAALESAFAVALNAVFDLKADSFTLAKAGQKAEHNYVGVRCGIMDQFASIFGKKEHVFKLDCRSLEYEYFPLKLDGYELILADTKVKHSLASSEYNLRREQCEEGVMIMATKMHGIMSLRDVSPVDVEIYKGMLGEEVYMRCLYVTEENQRVLDTCEALEAGDIEKVGKLLYRSHEGLSNLYNVSCPELDLLVESARTIDGVMGARMMGGGFGGCTINLVKSSAAKEFKEKISVAFKAAFGKSPEFYDVQIDDGAREL